MNLQMPDFDERNFARVLAAKQQMSMAIFNITARVRDEVLRPVSQDGFKAVLEAVREAEEDAAGDALN